MLRLGRKSVNELIQSLVNEKELHTILVED
jgi:hypothetical protein